ncbi:MAG: LytTR family DNA-binding domain-containing protein [Natronospirillum sp.]|uniref:LytR/AlgR family response regulator transcription factor n=1 Tax=Natronospirillum sp. TaxID=2812955 RepID=UPI0025F3B5AB|nr:LytTR family DNA-binding domain-containing protein [Natronospirillum sp.]MCH8551129.1 LytTR family DNA-binding domain-containing protein [Natronospirillum sp.]
MSELRVLIADDEPMLRFHLQQMLEDLWPEIDKVLTAANGEEALEMARSIRPQAIFLDIRMPGLSGIEVAERLQQEGLTRASHVVFLTAYDDYAVQAFEREAVDYVLKPVDDQRLLQSITRLQERLRAPEPVLADLSDLKRWVGRERGDWLKWINAQQGEDIHVIAVESVLLFRAEYKYTTVVTPDGEYLIRKSLKQLEEELDPDAFWRVHRSAIVRVPAIERVRRDLSGGLKIHIRGLKKPQPVSRRFADRFRQM